MKGLGVCCYEKLISYCHWSKNSRTQDVLKEKLILVRHVLILKFIMV